MTVRMTEIDYMQLNRVVSTTDSHHRGNTRREKSRLTGFSPLYTTMRTSNPWFSALKKDTCHAQPWPSNWESALLMSRT